MKPLKISISAFGPYADKQEIDFNTLEDRNFFLIHGPTGSGKTSILDAICFALYGETSGGERKTRTIRSDYADIEDETEVTFEFSLGNKRFLINRSPEQDRPKKRGEGTTKQLSKAVLWEIIEDKKTVLADRWLKVTEEVKRLTGFNVNQFRQVVILPQGQFRKFLLADSADRQAILETLFQTEIYRKIEEALKEAAKKIKNKAEEFITRKEFILEQAEVKSIEELLHAIEITDDCIKEKNDKLQIKKKEEAEAQEKLETARKIILTLEEKEKARNYYQKLKNEEKDIERKKEVLIKGRKAEKLEDAEKNLQIRENEEKSAKSDHKKAEENLITVKIEKEAVEKKYKSEKNRISEINRLRVEIETLKQTEKSLTELEKAKKDLERVEEKTGKAEKIYRSAKEEFSSLKKEIEETRTKYEIISEDLPNTETLRLLIETNEKEYERLSRIIKTESEKEEAKKIFENRKEKLGILEAVYLKSKKELVLLESEWLNGQAVVLSESLIENQPCPVCGSMEHPNPASSETGGCDEITLNKKRAEIQKSEEQFQLEKEEVDRLKEQYLSFKVQLDTLKDNRNSVSEKSLAEIETVIRESKRTLNKTEEDKRDLKKLKTQIEKKTDSENLKTKQLQEYENAFVELDKKKEALSAVYQEKKKGIPDQYKTAADVRKEIESREKEIKAFENNFRQLEEQFNLSVKTLAASEENVVKTSDSHKKAVSAVGETRERFLEKMKKEGFNDIGEYKNAALTGSEIEALDIEISNYKENLKAAEVRFKRAEKAAEGCKEPDIKIVETRLVEVKKSVEEVVKAKSRFETLKKQKKELYRQYLEVVEKAGVLDSEYAVTGRLSEVANGKNSLGMTFQRYVLATLLEDVLYAAGIHLQAMSRGRFNLLRSNEREDMRSAGGLDLIVSDSYTGTTRPVNSLSGGESFLASLSLALGLADVVQTYAGGIRLDTIFVDEGFGSLDPETLDLAFKAFSDLKATGRLIGVISHVPELKERISTRLEVVPGKRGSEAVFVL